MAAKCRAQHICFSVDLCEQAVNHLEILNTVHNFPDLKEPEVLRHALYRYERFWLPLAADHPEECLAAPLDVEFVWYCHMLNPEAYATDCHKVVGTTVNHKLYSRNDFLEKQKTTEKLWSQKYRNKCEPFTVDRDVKYWVTENQSYQSRISIDIVAIAQKQIEFYYQVSLPHYRDIKFLENSVLRYKQFLYLKKVTQEFLIPSCDIDLTWRSHLLNPVVYKDDMVKNVGHLLNHGGFFHNRCEDLQLHESEKETEEETEEIWKTFFHEKYSLSGAMYRIPPTGRLYNTSRDDVYMFETMSSKFTLKKLTLTLCSKMLRNVKLTGFGVRNSQFRNKLFTLKRVLNLSSETNTVIWRDAGSYDLDTNSVYGIGFQLHLWLGRLCCQSTETCVSTNIIEILQFTNENFNAVTGGKLNSHIVFDNAILDIKGQFSPVECQTAIFFLKRGHYHMGTIPDHVLHLCGPAEKEKCSSGTSRSCYQATHSLNPLVPGAYRMNITVRTIHNYTVPLSVIQVFYNDKMAAIAHVIASDQLPLPTQVTKNEITLDPSQGEKAVIIKSNTGDWGIVLGRWVDLTRGVKGIGCK
ncbi:uncharacterized protein LOC123545093 isoform X2 [Mercenaria mercenaria]|uniref:uncharacterized protein LOC123545093 isoform X2 n=1 Tax=Mercenaria mercenaria TaxID=6596 RepID=UPI00234EBD29|nr:uncharacterized protein LOC123545093 isoform X2 [Mercenaria mercenaria]